MCDVDGEGFGTIVRFMVPELVTELDACFERACPEVFDPCFSGVFASWGLDF